MARYQTFDEIIHAAVLYGYNQGAGDKHYPDDGEKAAQRFRESLAEGQEHPPPVIPDVPVATDWVSSEDIGSDIGQRTRDFYTGWASPFARGW